MEHKYINTFTCMPIVYTNIIRLRLLL